MIPAQGADPGRARLSRRGLVAAALAGCVGRGSLAAPAPALSPNQREWNLFCEGFLSKDGCVIDTGNGGISHSEGQGIALLAAQQFGDRATFDRIWDWTRTKLRRPRDGLHSWRFRPNAPMPVDDPNNATDGDLLIAFALFLAAARWQDDKLRQEATRTTQAILTLLVRETSAGVVLLPGETGFDHFDRVVVNPSYYVFPALAHLAKEVPHPAWQRVWDGGRSLIRDARFGQWRLPPDWLSIPKAGHPVAASGWPARFSFDAVRVPLYLTWAGLGDDPAVDAIINFWGSYSDFSVPAWADLDRGYVAPYVQSSGMVAVRHYVHAARTGNRASLPSIQSATDYYAGALTLLARVATDMTARTS